MYNKNNELAQNAQPDAQNGAKPSGDTPVFFFLNSKFREAICHAHDFDKWKKSDDKGAKIACSMFDKYLSDNEFSYDRLRFITEPVGPYYFMIAHLERELNVIRPIHIEQGVIEYTEGVLDKFAKDIKVLETTETAERLARMFHCFHAELPMRLATIHQDESPWRAEQNAPDMKKNEDGSITLVYDLFHSGRSVAVFQWTVNIDTDYKVTLDCKRKKKKITERTEP